MSTVFFAVDKPYGVTADGKLVDPKHVLCRQIIAHHQGQEVPVVLLQQAGLTTGEGQKIAYKGRDYDDVEIPNEYKPKSEQQTATRANANTITLTPEALQKLLEDAATAGAAAALAAAKK